jgi:hypothetical protein
MAGTHPLRTPYAVSGGSAFQLPFPVRITRACVLSRFDALFRSNLALGATSHEVILCRYCKQPLNKETDAYVVIRKAADSPSRSTGPRCL